MINLTEFALKSSEFSLLYKINSLRDPDFYLAENMRDFKTNAPYINFPWYKGFPVLEGFDPKEWRAYIAVHNVGIEFLEEDDFSKKFLVHDSTDRAVMCWHNKKGFLQPYKTFEELQEEQGLKHKDWVYEVLFLYYITERVSIIGNVKKCKPLIRIKEESLVDRVSNLTPQLLSQPI